MDAKLYLSAYEGYGRIFKDSGKRTIFVFYACMDSCADVVACGTIGIIRVFYTDYKSLICGPRDSFLAGEGDNRMLGCSVPARMRIVVISFLRPGSYRAFICCELQPHPLGYLLHR